MKAISLVLALLAGSAQAGCDVYGCPWPDTCSGKTCCPPDTPVICEYNQSCCPTGTVCDGNYCSPTFMGFTKDGKKEPVRASAGFKNATEGGSTCTGAGEFCCGAPAGDVNNCPSSARTDDCDAKNDCCCG